MNFITAGNAVGCTINSHRRGWDGSICRNAETWNCSAKQQFRTDFCQQGDPRCYHIHVFEEGTPYCLIDDLGIGWLLENYPDALNNQIMLFWGKRFQEPRGISEINTRSKDYVFGAYRVQAVECVRINDFKTVWKIIPYHDGWIRFQQPHTLTVYYRTIQEGPYLKEINRVAVENLFKAAEQAVGPSANWIEPRDEERFNYFYQHLGDWFEQARTDMQKVKQKMLASQQSSTRADPPIVDEIEPIKGPFDQLKNLDVKKADTEIRTYANPKRLPPYGLIEKENSQAKIRSIYGKDVLDALLAVSISRNMLILTGNPGVGKSTLANELIEDSERKLIVTVGSTWRGREDLLGYVNPISNEFEPTEFSRFIARAEAAWRKNDRRTYLVIFEEFNLSQPEYWFADILARSQYPEEQEKLRTLELGGKSIRGMPNTQGGRIFLTPALRFVATINNDHTTLSLSPRVLDRAAIVELSLEARTTLERAALVLEEKQIMAIEELEELLKYKDAMFSLRAADSLKRCIEHREQLNLYSIWDALDIVLLQQVLTKVRLLVGDPANDGLLQGLEEWRESYGKNLRKCANLISSWGEALKDGRDVIQA